jgi:integrase
MANLVRPWIVRYLGTDGKRVGRGAPGARRVKERARKWYAQGVPGWPKKKRVPLASDKKVAKKMLADLVDKAERGEVGWDSPVTRAQAVPLREHLDAYARYLAAKGDSPGHVQKAPSRCRKVLDGIKAESVGDLQPSAVMEFLAGLREAPPAPELPPGQEWFTKAQLVAALGVNPASVARMMNRDGLQARGQGKARRYHRSTVEALQARLCRGVGIPTSNLYLTALKGFSRWLVRDRRAPSDPLACLSRLNADTDIRLQRRALSPGEFAALLDAARRGRTFRGLTGEDRAVLYHLAARTGLRAGELASLTPASFDLSAEPTVTVEAAYSKHRRKDVLDLRPDVAALVREYVRVRPEGEPLWPGAWHHDGAELIRVDLAAAGVPYADAAGRTYDFHALRHQFISDMVEAGVHPKDAQTLARHSSITLTMDRYAHVRRPNLRAALDRLPGLSAPPPHGQAARKHA